MIDELISIYIPTHNRIELLRKAVNSILEQTYTNWELIIVNDASTDNTEEYLKKISSSDSRIRYFTNETPKGACYSRNIAIKNSSGKYITGLDDDDVFTKERLQVFINNYDSTYSFLSSDWRTFPFSLKNDIKRKLIYKYGEISLNSLLNKNHIGNQIFIEKYKLIEIGGFDESLLAWQDYDLWVRLVYKYGKAFKLKNETQLILADNTIKRITNSSNRVKGIEAFLAKHKVLLSTNQEKRIINIIRKIR